MKTKRVSKLLAVLAMGLTLASCGKDNKAGNVTGNGYSSPFTLGNGQSTSMQQLRQQNPCQFNQYPSTNVSFTVIGQNSNYITSQQIQMGGGFSGNGNYYIGGDYGTRDLIVVQKVANGHHAQFNVQMSICPTYNGQIQVQNVLGVHNLAVGLGNGSGVGGTVYFNATINGMQFPNEQSIFAP